jgi:hypothetical protein
MSAPTPPAALSSAPSQAPRRFVLFRRMMHGGSLLPQELLTLSSLRFSIFPRKACRLNLFPSALFDFGFLGMNLFSFGTLCPDLLQGQPRRYWRLRHRAMTQSVPFRSWGFP